MVGVCGCGTRYEDGFCVALCLECLTFWNDRMAFHGNLTRANQELEWRMEDRRIGRE